MKSERKGQRFKFFQHRLQIQRDNLQLALADGANVAARLAGGKPIGGEYNGSGTCDGNCDHADSFSGAHAVFRAIIDEVDELHSTAALK